MRQLLNSLKARLLKRLFPVAAFALVAGLIALGLIMPRKSCAQFPQQTITGANAVHPKSVFSADVSGDGNADVLSASLYDGSVAWYENQVGETGAGPSGFGPQKVITTDAFYASSVHAADIDGDGDQDVIATDLGDDKIAWYENQVGETGADYDGFGSQNVITVDMGNTNPESIYATDVDGDGDTDVLSALSYDNKIVWYENQIGESGADDDGFRSQQVITTDAAGAQSVHAADADGDGDVDVFSASAFDSEIAWYENQIGEDGADDDGFGPRQVIAGTDQAQSVYAADIDGDGAPDILSASAPTAADKISKIAWHENQIGESGADGDGFGPKQVITTEVDEAMSVFATDIDGDGDSDALSASLRDNKVSWYENQIGEDGADEDNFGPQQVITTGAAGAQSVHVADADGDGDLDALSASSFDNKIAWYKNLVGESGADSDGFGYQRAITPELHNPRSVHTADVDEDGDADVLSASLFDGDISWYENQFGESGADEDGFGSQRVIRMIVAAPFTTTARSVFASDLDGDSDPDVLSGSR